MDTPFARHSYFAVLSLFWFIRHKFEVHSGVCKLLEQWKKLKFGSVAIDSELKDFTAEVFIVFMQSKKVDRRLWKGYGSIPSLCAASSRIMFQEPTGPRLDG